MFKKPIPVWHILLALVFITGSVIASTPIVHISPKPTWLNTYKPYDKSIPLRDVENGYFLQLLEEQVHVEKQARYTHVIRQIVSGAGIQNGSEISISFDPSFERLDVHEITVWRDNKPQNRLSAHSFKMIADEKELSRFIYQGSYSAYCILDDIRKGDRIEYSLTITGRNPIFGNHYSDDIYLQQSQAIAHLYKALLVSPQRKLYFKTFNKVPKTNVFDKNGLKCYEWEDFQIKRATDYANQPGWYTSYGLIQISDYGNWADVVNWALNVNPVPATVHGELAKRVVLLKTQAGDDKEKYFRGAVKLVQDEVRYMGIELGQYSHKANNPEKVYSQRYGDCKDKALLLATILNADGIPANMVLLNSTAKSKIDQYLPSPFVFDHAITVATVNNKQVWIDPTIAYQRGTGADLYFPDYGKGLILKPGNTVLTAIPPSKAGKITCNETYTIPNNNGKVSLEVVTTYTLNEADKIRSSLASSSMTETDKSYLDYYAKTYPKIEAQDSVSVIDDEATNKLIITEHYFIAGFFKKDTTTGQNQASFYANFISEQLTSINNKIQYPRTLNYPYAINYKVSVVLPSGWSVNKRQTSINRDAYSFASQESAIGDTLFLTYQFSYLQSFLPVNKLDEYQADAKQIKENNLSYSFYYSPDAAENSSVRLNYWMLIGVIAFALVIGGICVKIYLTPTQGVVFKHGETFKPLGGWLLFIAFGLTVSPLVLLVSFCKGVYFNTTSWNAHTHTATELPFKALITFEALGNTLMICYALFCLILLLNRRDILPKFITGLYIYIVVFLIVDYAIAKYFYPNTASVDSAVTSIIRAIVISAIWIPYFRISFRVKETFRVPHPANNYRYEELEVVVADNVDVLERDE
jgi:transglutaminase-like putative cysteine protease